MGVAIEVFSNAGFAVAPFFGIQVVISEIEESIRLFFFGALLQGGVEILQFLFRFVQFLATVYYNFEQLKISRMPINLQCLIFTLLILMLVVQDLHILFLYFWIVLDLQFILDLLHNVVYAQL